MANLYTRARDAHTVALLKLVEGQVRSAMADHKEWNLSARAARSIAKRVTGDVAANWSRLSALRGSSNP